MKSNNRERWIEILAVVITGSLKYILVDWINLKLFYITGVCLFWIAFIIMKYRRNHGVLKDWGFQRAHFSRSFLFLLPFAIVTSTIIILYGIKANLALVNWHIIPILVFYPVWGLVQQFMMIGLISRNLKIIYSQRLDQVHIVLITSLFFCFSPHTQLSPGSLCFFHGTSVHIRLLQVEESVVIGVGPRLDFRFALLLCFGQRHVG